MAEEYGTKTCAEIRDFSRSLAAYQNAWNGDDNAAYPMRFEDFFAETPDRAPILQELREDQQLRRMLVDPSA